MSEFTPTDRERAEWFYWLEAMRALHRLQGAVSEDDHGMRTADDEMLYLWPEDLGARVYSAKETAEFENALRDYRFVRGDELPGEDDYNANRRELITRALGAH